MRRNVHILPCIHALVIGACVHALLAHVQTYTTTHLRITHCVPGTVLNAL